MSETPQRVVRLESKKPGNRIVVSLLPTDYALLPEGDKRPTEQDRKQVDNITRITDNRFEEIRLEWQQIARSEVSRQQRKLGFTAQQQREVESALVAVTDGLFERLLGNVSSTAQMTCLKIWRRNRLVVS